MSSPSTRRLHPQSQHHAQSKRESPAMPPTALLPLVHRPHDTLVHLDSLHLECPLGMVPMAMEARHKVDPTKEREDRRHPPGQSRNNRRLPSSNKTNLARTRTKDEWHRLFPRRLQLLDHLYSRNNQHRPRTNLCARHPQMLSKRLATRVRLLKDRGRQLLPQTQCHRMDDLPWVSLRRVPPNSCKPLTVPLQSLTSPPSIHTPNRPYPRINAHQDSTTGAAPPSNAKQWAHHLHHHPQTNQPAHVLFQVGLLAL
jgi:hypothetical protein